jgi:hypothetical protein
MKGTGMNTGKKTYQTISAIIRGPAMLLGIFLLMGATCPGPGNPPVISELDPPSGPAGTIVTVRGSRFGTGGTVNFDGSNVSTQGTGSPLVFTVPYDATSGNKNVHVTIGGERSADVPFNVTATASAPTPVADGFEVGYYALLNSADENLMELAVFGSGFDTNCDILLDGNAITNSLLAGIPVGSLVGVFTPGIMSFHNNPPERWDNAVICLLTATDGNLPALGSTHTVAVRNTVSGVTSGDVSVTIPSRRTLIEMDKLTTVDFPPRVIWRDNTLNTARRTYTAAGMILDIRQDEDVIDPIAGTAFSDADLVDFFNANSNMDDDAFTGEWYMHAAFLTNYDLGIPGWNILGIMWADNRRGYALFENAFTADANYLRSMLHEMGHGFNLTHCDGDAIPQRDASGNLVFTPGGAIVIQTDGTSIMNQTGASAANWNYDFTNQSETHIRTFSANEVQPGQGNIEFNSALRTNGECQY